MNANALLVLSQDMTSLLCFLIDSNTHTITRGADWSKNCGPQPETNICTSVPEQLAQTP